MLLLVILKKLKMSYLLNIINNKSNYVIKTPIANKVVASVGSLLPHYIIKNRINYDSNEVWRLISSAL